MFSVDAVWVQATASVVLPLSLYALARRQDKRDERRLEKAALQTLYPRMNAVNALCLRLAAIDVNNQVDEVLKVADDFSWPSLSEDFEIISHLAAKDARRYISAANYVAAVYEEIETIRARSPHRQFDALFTAPLSDAVTELKRYGSTAAHQFCRSAKRKVPELSED